MRKLLLRSIIVLLSLNLMIPFTEVLAASTSNITITSPKGGENWVIGSTHNITWNSIGITGNVNIYLSRDSGTTWTIIISKTLNDGKSSWKVTRPATSQARIKVVSISTPTVFGTNITNFNITAAPTITGFSPASGGTGTSVIITGTNFTGATAVSFGATAATSFTVNSSTQITTVVGSGSTGLVSVVTPGGTANSSGTFTFTADIIVIAASDAPENWKSQATTICTGTNDTDVIRSYENSILNLSNAWSLQNLGNPVMDYGNFGLVWYDGSIYHCYYAYSNFTKIGHATSSDGLTWTNDTAHNPVLACGNTSYDNIEVAVANVWVENGIWYMLYRGNGSKIALATSLDGLSWTKYGSNPVVNRVNDAVDPAGIMKVGSTYYLYANTTGGDRCISIMTSTDLYTWTIQTPDPTFIGGRFCCCPFLYKGTYYLLISRYYDGYRGGELELWSSSSPLFTEGNRNFIGVVAFNANKNIDTPTIATLSITRDITSESNMKVWYSVTNNGGYYLYYTIQSNIATALSSGVMPGKGTIVLSPGTFYTPASLIFRPLSVVYGNVINGNGSKIKLPNGVSTNNNIIEVQDVGSVIRDIEIDGNKANVTGTQQGIIVSHGALAENVEAHDFTQYGFYLITGVAMGCQSYNNNLDGFYIAQYGLVDNCQAYGNRRYGFGLYSTCSSTTKCVAYYNVEYGFLLAGQYSTTSFSTSYSNGGGYYFTGANSSATNNPVAHDNAGEGYDVAANNVQLLSPVSYNNGMTGIAVDSGGTNLLITNPNIYHNNYKGIISLATYTVIQGGAIHNQTANFGVEFDGANGTIVGTKIFDNPGYANLAQIAIGSNNCTLDNVQCSDSTGTQQYSVYITSNGTGTLIENSSIPAGTLGSVYIAATGVRIINSPSYSPDYTPVNPSKVTLSSSPFIFTCGTSPTFLLVSDGTVSSIITGSIDTGLTSGIFYLTPSQILLITYTVAPTVLQDIEIATAIPTITGFSPISSGPGTSVIITGTNFTGATAVSFGTTAASSFTVNSSAQITAVVGSGSTGLVSVVTPGGTANSSGTFTFTAAPSISGFSPTSGGMGTSVIITGTNFTGATAVSFGATAATSFTVNSSTQITAVVGSGSTGLVSVVTPGGTTNSSGTFTFTQSGSTSPPAVDTLAATNITATSATLNGKLRKIGSASSNIVIFEFGLTNGLGTTIAGVPSTFTVAGTFSVVLTGLTPNTSYYFRADSTGDGTDYGATQTFTTAQSGS